MKMNQVTTPALILDLDAFERNLDRMMKRVEVSGGKLRPHYKTNKCVDIALRQMAAGAKGITCAKLGEARDLIEAGVEDVLIANQVVDKAKVAEIAALAACCRLSVAVDQAENIRDLEAAAAYQNSTIHCFIEYEIGMQRCGVATKEELLELAQLIDQSPHLVFEGIQAYAGHLAHVVSKDARVKAAADIQKKVREAVEYLEARGLKVHEVSGCSTSSVLDHAVPGTVYTEFQAGSYIYMDRSYRTLPDLEFENALFVLTTVISKAAGRTITDAGMKAVSFDQQPPAFVGYEDIPIGLSEEHATADLPEQETAIGDKLLMIPGHCCTCVNLYDYLIYVRGDQVVNKVPITSRGKAQ